MHRVGSAGSNGGSVRTRKEKKLTYVLNDANDTKVRLFYTNMISCHPWLCYPSFDFPFSGSFISFNQTRLKIA